MKVTLLVPLTLTLFASCALERTEPDPPTAGSAGSGTGGSSGGSSGGKSGGSAGSPGGRAGSAGDGAGNPSGGRSGNDGSGGTEDETAGAGGNDDPDAGGGGAAGSEDGGAAGRSSAGSGGSGTSGDGAGGSSAGTSGSTGSGGSSGSSNAGSGGTGNPDTPIQNIQRGNVGMGQTVTVAHVRVTGLRVQGNGSTNLNVQEPQGATVSGVTYPQYAGIMVFAPDTDAIALGMSEAIVGDCVSVTGEVSEFQSTSELVEVTEYQTHADSECDAFPQPFVASVNDIATDIDPALAGDQPGMAAEVYEGVLMRVNNVTVTTIVTSPPDTYRVRGTGMATLHIGDFYIGTVPSTSVGRMYASITGVLDQYNSFRLLPRSAADIVD